MPSYVRNTGMSSLNELFAMKKNLAYETKFEHQLSAMMKDFFHKKENLKQDIRMVYNDLQSIKLSTGYSLNQAESPRSMNALCKRPSIPTIYLPPIGVRLVQKYTGVDVRRQSLIGEYSVGGQQRTLDSILNQTIGIGKKDSKSTSTTNENTKKVEFLVDKEGMETKTENPKTSYFREENDLSVNQIISTTLPEVTEIQGCGNPFLQRNERPLDDTTIFKPADDTLHDDVISNAQVTTEHEDSENTAHGPIALTENSNNDERTLLDTDYDLTERRSSRSTFRGRSSTRLPSKSCALSQYNLGVVGLSKGKSNVGNFYLDYGDGKLHDSMEIPKVKDCSRPWCNPHCKTCRNRTFSRPCFILIPTEENVRKRQIPQDKRRPSMFPKYLSFQSKEQAENSAQNVRENDETNLTFPKDTSNNSDTLGEIKINGIEHIGLTHDPARNDTGIKDGENDNITTEIGQCEHQIAKIAKRGYSRKRMNELAMPRGGPPAEVRFSKMSLRKKQEQLIEDERTKALTKFEKENLTNIQGKISMFLALLNQQELKGKPVKMVDIPVRMDIITRDKSKGEMIQRKRRRNVHFNSRPRLLS